MMVVIIFFFFIVVIIYCDKETNGIYSKCKIFRAVGLLGGTLGLLGCFYPLSACIVLVIK